MKEIKVTEPMRGKLISICSKELMDHVKKHGKEYILGERADYEAEIKCKNPLLFIGVGVMTY